VEEWNSRVLDHAQHRILPEDLVLVLHDSLDIVVVFRILIFLRLFFLVLSTREKAHELLWLELILVEFLLIVERVLSLVSRKRLVIRLVIRGHVADVDVSLAIVELLRHHLNTKTLISFILLIAIIVLSDIAEDIECISQLIFVVKDSV
jgi:hypothetical protein